MLNIYTNLLKSNRLDANDAFFSQPQKIFLRNLARTNYLIMFIKDLIIDVDSNWIVQLLDSCINLERTVEYGAPENTPSIIAVTSPTMITIPNIKTSLRFDKSSNTWLTLFSYTTVTAEGEVDQVTYKHSSSAPGGRKAEHVVTGHIECSFSQCTFSIQEQSETTSYELAISRCAGEDSRNSHQDENGWQTSKQNSATYIRGISGKPPPNENSSEESTALLAFRKRETYWN